MSETFDFKEFPVLETARLRLREIRDGDVDDVLAIFGDDETSRYLVDQDCRPLRTREEAQREIIDWCRKRFADRLGLRWALTLGDGSDRLIGTAGFNTWHRKDQRADIGYDLNRSHWGKGLMTEVVQALIRFGFDRMDLHRIEADVTRGNDASMRVLEKCGFVHEGTWRETVFAGGAFHDLEQFSLLRGDLRHELRHETDGR